MRVQNIFINETRARGTRCGNKMTNNPRTAYKTRLHACNLASMHARMLAWIENPLLLVALAHALAFTPVLSKTHARACTYARKPACGHAHADTYAHADMLMRTHTRMRTCSCRHILSRASARKLACRGRLRRRNTREKHALRRCVIKRPREFVKAQSPDERGR